MSRSIYFNNIPNNRIKKITEILLNLLPIECEYFDAPTEEINYKIEGANNILGYNLYYTDYPSDLVLYVMYSIAKLHSLDLYMDCEKINQTPPVGNPFKYSSFYNFKAPNSQRSILRGLLHYIIYNYNISSYKIGDYINNIEDYIEFQYTFRY